MIQKRNQRTIANASLIKNNKYIIAIYIINLIQPGCPHSFNSRFIFLQDNIIFHNNLTLHHKSIGIFDLNHVDLIQVFGNGLL